MANFLDIIEWFDDTGEEIVHRVPESGSDWPSSRASWPQPGERSPSANRNSAAPNSAWISRPPRCPSRKRGPPAGAPPR